MAFDIFKLREATISNYLKSLDIPEVKELDEKEIYSVLIKVRQIRNKLLKFTYDLRDTKIQFSEIKESNDICKSEVIQELKSTADFSKLKTKEERDLVIQYELYKRASYVKELDIFNLRLSSLQDLLVKTLSELEKIFNEFELIYNIGKLNSYGYLISQANSKLNSIT